MPQIGGAGWTSWCRRRPSRTRRSRPGGIAHRCSNGPSRYPRPAASASRSPADFLRRDELPVDEQPDALGPCTTEVEHEERVAVRVAAEAIGVADVRGALRGPEQAYDRGGVALLERTSHRADVRE